MRKIKSMFAILVFSFLGLLSGCATVAQGPSFSEARAVDTKSDKALIYVYRKYAAPTAWGSTIHFDDAEVSTLNQGGFTWAYLTPGTHKIRAVWPGLSGQIDSFIVLSVEAKKVYYLELLGISQLVGVGPSVGLGTMTLHFRMGSGMNEVDPEMAEPILRYCCKFQKPRALEY